MTANQHPALAYPRRRTSALRADLGLERRHQVPTTQRTMTKSGYVPLEERLGWTRNAIRASYLRPSPAHAA
eukprot:9301677-Prorocentrum_lima.AAC.1